jgi:hypothetical protein
MLKNDSRRKDSILKDFQFNASHKVRQSKSEAF